MNKANSIIRLVFFHPGHCDPKKTYNFIFLDTGELVLDCPFSKMKKDINNVACFECTPLDEIAEDHISNCGIHDTFEQEGKEVGDENSFFFKIAQKVRDFIPSHPFQPLKYDVAFLYDSWYSDSPDGRGWESSYELVGFVKKIDIHVQPLEEVFLLYEKETK